MTNRLHYGVKVATMTIVLQNGTILLLLVESNFDPYSTGEKRRDEILEFYYTESGLSASQMELKFAEFQPETHSYVLLFSEQAYRVNVHIDSEGSLSVKEDACYELFPEKLTWSPGNRLYSPHATCHSLNKQPRLV